MSSKKKIKQLKSLLVIESDDDAALFRAAVEQLDPAAVQAKLEAHIELNETVARAADKVQEIDLHRCTVEEARRAMDALIAQLVTAQGPAARAGGHLRLKVITGKGRHSGPGGPVLAREIHRYISETYASHIVSIEASPVEVMLGGLPLRGHFHVVLRR